MNRLQELFLAAGAVCVLEGILRFVKPDLRLFWAERAEGLKEEQRRAFVKRGAAVDFLLGAVMAAAAAVQPAAGDSAALRVLWCGLAAAIAVRAAINKRWLGRFFLPGRKAGKKRMAFGAVLGAASAVMGIFMISPLSGEAGPGPILFVAVLTAVAVIGENIVNRK